PSMLRPPLSSTLFPYTTLFRSLFVCKGALFKRDYLLDAAARGAVLYISETDYHLEEIPCILVSDIRLAMPLLARKFYQIPADAQDRKSTRLNSSHVSISYAVFC